MRSWWGEGAGLCIALVEVVDIRPAVVSAVVGGACAGPLLGSRLFDNSRLHCGPLCCLVPCCVPFAENFGCLVDGILPAVGIFAIAGGFAAVPAIAVFVLLVVPTIYWRGQKVARLYYCSGDVPLFFALAFALGVVVASAWRLLLVLLGPRTPFETVVHSPQLVVLPFELLPPRCLLFLALLLQSVLPAPAGGPLGCLRGPVALPFLCLPLVGVLLRRILFAGWGMSCDLTVSSTIPCSLRGITLTFLYRDKLFP